MCIPEDEAIYDVIANSSAEVCLLLLWYMATSLQRSSHGAERGQSSLFHFTNSHLKVLVDFGDVAHDPLPVGPIVAGHFIHRDRRLDTDTLRGGESETEVLRL